MGLAISCISLLAPLEDDNIKSHNIKNEESEWFSIALKNLVTLGLDFDLGTTHPLCLKNVGVFVFFARS